MSLPHPAPLWQQIVGLAVLVAIAGAAAVLAATAEAAPALIAAGAAFVLATFVLIVWAAAALGTGLGPKQLLEVLKVFAQAVGQAKDSDGRDGDGKPASDSNG